MTEAVNPKLSILVCALNSRRPVSDFLFAEINRQIKSLPDASHAELHSIFDEGEMAVGEKRNRLVAMAKGDYLCFVDDDDWISPHYVEKLVAHCDGVADCIVFAGMYTCDGQQGRPFDFDLKYKRFRNLPHVYERTPNHLVPIRSSIAKSVSFPTLNFGEDTHYAARVRPKLSTQSVCLDDVDPSRKAILYHYRFSHAGTRTGGKRTP